ncbi:MAG: hypothetical protein ACXABD_00360 [Candidatus Thorarchaeota archaeon]
MNRPSEQYENIIRSLKSETPSKKSSVSKAVTSDDNAMKDELKNFLAKEMKTKKETPVFSSMDGGLAPGGGGNLTFSSYT